MILIVGLGNPGKEYVKTRHNVGFMALDAIVSSSHNEFAENTKFKGDVATCEIIGKKAFALKPNTYMNLSGESVQLLCNYYKIIPSNVIVIHDDIDLALGECRIKLGGGHAGHNGLKSLDRHIGKEYWRVRIGVGRPENKDDVSDYVLENFTKTEKATINEIVVLIPQLVQELIVANNY